VKSTCPTNNLQAGSYILWQIDREKSADIGAFERARGPFVFYHGGRKAWHTGRVDSRLFLTHLTKRPCSSFGIAIAEIRPSYDQVIFSILSGKNWLRACGSQYKRKDRFVRAFARISRTHSSRLMMIAWGRDLDATCAFGGIAFEVPVVTNADFGAAQRGFFKAPPVYCGLRTINFRDA
jgi:hypothetical protein